MTRVLKLTESEYQHLQVTLEGCKEEFEELSESRDWYVTALPERIDDCLLLLETATKEENES